MFGSIKFERKYDEKKIKKNNKKLRKIKNIFKLNNVIKYEILYHYCNLWMILHKYLL